MKNTKKIHNENNNNNFTNHCIYISIIAEGFIYGIAEGLGRLGIVSLISAIIISILYFLYKDDKNNDD